MKGLYFFIIFILCSSIALAATFVPSGNMSGMNIYGANNFTDYCTSAGKCLNNVSSSSFNSSNYYNKTDIDDQQSAQNNTISSINTTLNNKINAVNTTGNIQSLGFNTTTQLDSWYVKLSNLVSLVGNWTADKINYYTKTDVYNKTEVNSIASNLQTNISNVNSSLAAETNARIGNDSLKYNASNPSNFINLTTGQPLNDSAAILAEQNARIANDSLKYNASNPSNFINATTGQIFNDTSAINNVDARVTSLNSTKALAGSSAACTYGIANVTLNSNGVPTVTCTNQQGDITAITVTSPAIIGGATSGSANIALNETYVNSLWNDTALANSALNLATVANSTANIANTTANSKAGTGTATCAAGTVAQNITTTTSGITSQCVAASAGAGDGTGGWTNNSGTTTTNYNVTINNFTSINNYNTRTNSSSFGFIVNAYSNLNSNEVSPIYSKHAIAGFINSIGIGNETRLIGTTGEVFVSQNKPSNAIGLYSLLALGDGLNNGKVGNWYGLSISSTDNTGSGTVDNYIGISVDTPQVTTTNFTGIYIGDSTATNNYAIRTGNGLVSFGGNVTAPNIQANMSWSYLKDYPSACSAGNAITGLGDSNTCTAFLQSESDPTALKNNTDINLSNNNKIYSNGGLRFNSTGNVSTWNFTSDGSSATINIQSMNDGAGHTGGLLQFTSSSWGNAAMKFGELEFSYGSTVSDIKVGGQSSAIRFVNQKSPYQEMSRINLTRYNVYVPMYVYNDTSFNRSINVSENITAQHYYYPNGTELVNGGTSGGATPQGLDGQLQVKNGTSLAGTAVYYVNTLAGLQSALADNSSSTKKIYVTSTVSVNTPTNFNLYGSNEVYGFLAIGNAQINTTRVGTSGSGIMSIMNSIRVADDTVVTYYIGAYTQLYFVEFTSDYSGSPAQITFNKGAFSYVFYMNNVDGLTLTNAVRDNWKYADIPKTGSNQTLVTGTAGSTGQIAKWDAQGNIYGSTELDPLAVKNGTSANLTQVIVNGTDIGDLVMSRYNEFSYLKMLEDDQCGVKSVVGEAWYGTSIVSGTTTTSTGYATHPCVRALRIATRTGSGYALNTGVETLLLNGSESTDIIFYKNSRANLNMTTLRLGFQDTVAATVPTDGVYIEISNLTLTGRVRANNVELNTSTKFNITENAWYRARIEIAPNGTQARFYLYNSTTTTGAGNTVLLWQNNITGTLPTASGRQTGHGVTVFITNNNTAADVALIDYMNLKIDRALNR